MEVHAHSHSHGKKNWKSYFWEFLMLFLAVFCGFLAEYQLEHKIEKDREKQFLKTMIGDLEEDTTQLNKVIDRFQQKGIELDSLFILLNAGNSREYGAALYYLGRKANRFLFFTSTDLTIQQMKNSGAFRLIKKNNVATAILKYYSELNDLYTLQNNTNNLAMDYRLIAHTLFDPVIFETIVNEKTKNEVIRPAGNPSLVTYEKIPIQRVSAMIHYLQGSRLVLHQRYIELKIQAIELTELIKKEYHLK